MRRRASITLAAAACASLALGTTASAEATPLATVATRSVLAVGAQSAPSRTAFAFERESSTVAAAKSGATVRAIASDGRSSSLEAHGSGPLAVLSVSGFDLAPLLPSKAHTIGPSTRTFALGPPLGYEADRIRRVVLPRLKADSVRLVGIRGSLPPSFAGAPVVTATGRVVGAVAYVSADRWELAPLGALRALVHRSSSNAGSGAPLLSLLAGALVVFLAGAVFGLMRAKRRRERELESSLRRARRARSEARRDEVGSEPLVRFREPAETSATGTPQARDSEEEFDVVIKPHQET
jgi:hypothetical protein